MKMMKLALLGGAALAVTTASAMADDLSALKTSMENLGVIATPVADAPEGATITWSGYVRQALTWEDGTVNTIDGGTTGIDTGFDLAGGRAQLTVNATTPTSVGDVDVHVGFRANQVQGVGGGAQGVTFNEYWGTWHITPELSLQGGRMFTGGTSQGTTYGHSVGLSPSFATTTDNALQLGYASGPVSFVIGIEDGDDPVGGFHNYDSTPDFYANMAWSGDMFSIGLQGNYVINDMGALDNSYQIGGNISAKFSDAISLMMAGVVGHEECTFAATGCVAGLADGRQDYWGVSGRVRANVTEATMLEMSGGYLNSDVADVWNVNGGVYWTPASALTIGLQGDYTNTNPDLAGIDSTHYYSASLVTWWRF